MTHADKVRQQVLDLYIKLEQYHWSPRHPASYLIQHPENNLSVGIGVIAMREPGAFNLTYSAVQGALNSMADHKKAIGMFISFDKLMKIPVHDQEIGDWLTMLSKEEFTIWIQDVRNHQYIPTADIIRIRDALQLHEVRRL